MEAHYVLLDQHKIKVENFPSDTKLYK